MKQAYKKGLAIAQTEDRVYIAGSYWEMDVKREFLPKQILAQIYELAGEFPDVGERFEATKEGNQMQMGMSKAVSEEGFDEMIEVTRILIIGKNEVQQRVLQNTKGNIYIVNNAFVNIADNSATDLENGEYSVDKPFFNHLKGILWKNNVARFHACWRRDENHERILAELTQVDLTEDPVE